MRRFDRVSVRLDYTEGFAPVQNGTHAGALHYSWQFLPVDTREERLAVLLKWWAEDHQEGPTISNWV